MNRKERKSGLIIETVISPILDKYIKQQLNSSPIWKDCYHEDEELPNKPLYIYTIKFKHTTPVQVMNVTVYNKATK